MNRYHRWEVSGKGKLRAGVEEWYMDPCYGIALVCVVYRF